MNKMKFEVLIKDFSKLKVNLIKLMMKILI